MQCTHLQRLRILELRPLLATQRAAAGLTRTGTQRAAGAILHATRELVEHCGQEERWCTAIFPADASQQGLGGPSHRPDCTSQPAADHPLTHLLLQGIACRLLLPQPLLQRAQLPLRLGRAQPGVLLHCKKKEYALGVD